MADGAIGGMLAGWRKARRMSQLDLAMRAGTSTRHLSFIETGRSRPSRDMVLMLCDALRVPPRERNALLLAAGYAPIYRETPLEDPQMAPVLATLVLILRRQEPFPAVVFDRGWDIVMANAAYARIVARTRANGHGALAPFALTSRPRLNLLRLLCDPAGFRAQVANWEAVAAEVLARVRREIAGDRDPARRALLQEIQSYPGVPANEPDPDRAPDLLVPVELRDGDRTLRLLSTIATLGTALDITLQELRIELFYPADEETDRLVRAP